jgi:O-succinylbenzoate synthase
MKLRIDANEGLSVEQAKKWLGSVENLPVEFLEQPLKRHLVDEMIEISTEFSTEVALDESVATTQDIIDCYNRGFRGVFAAKPLRLGELRKFLDWREVSEAKISYSTIFESTIGSIFGIKLAASDKRNKFGLGFGVSHLLENTNLVFPSQPIILLDRILSIDRDKIWETIA